MYYTWNRSALGRHRDGENLPLFGVEILVNTLAIGALDKFVVIQR